MHKLTNLWKFWLNWSSKLQENNDRKNTIVAQICVLSDAWKRLHQAWSLLIFELEITFFSKTTLLQMEPFLTIFVYYQQLFIISYQVSFYANKYFE